MRGKLAGNMFKITLRGITPADAGKTVVADIISVIARDHPRGCGENYFSLKKGLTRTGSPPRMRGKPLIFVCSIGCIRITPADAGKTASVLLHTVSL